MSRYELLQFLHVSAAIIWLGAGIVVAVLAYAAESAGDYARQHALARDVDWLSARLFIPASLSVFLLGIGLVAEGPWSFDQLWISVGIGGFAASFLIGILFFKPESERVGSLTLGEPGAEAELSQRLARVNKIERAQLVVLFTVVADMVVKPTGDDTATVVVGAVIVALALIFAARALARPVTAAAQGPTAPS